MEGDENVAEDCGANEGELCSGETFRDPEFTPGRIRQAESSCLGQSLSRESMDISPWRDRLFPDTGTGRGIADS